MAMDRAQLRWNGWGRKDHPDPLAGRDEVWPWLAAMLGMPALLATPPRTLESITLPAPRLQPKGLAALTAILGPERLRQSAEERAGHALGRSYHDLLRLKAGQFDPPDAVLYSRNEDEVLALLRIAARTGDRHRALWRRHRRGRRRQRPRAAYFPAVVSLDLSRMDRVTGIDLVAGVAGAEAGIRGPELEGQLAAKGGDIGPSSAVVRIFDLGGMDCPSRRGPGQRALWPRLGLAGRSAGGDPAGISGNRRRSGLGRGPRPHPVDAGQRGPVRRHHRSAGAGARTAAEGRTSRLAAARFRRRHRRHPRGGARGHSPIPCCGCRMPPRPNSCGTSRHWENRAISGAVSHRPICRRAASTAMPRP